MNVDTLFNDIVNKDRTALAKGITLFESSLSEDWQKSKQLLKKIKTKDKKTKRIGFSGPPGVGKSTFIEKVGLELIRRGEGVAVLAIDPSSEITGGSILGDKTRMEELSRSSKAFIRPSANRGHLGGVTSSLPGVILLCEAAGFENILIESVGVGQSEFELAKMVDCFTLISQPGAGDELQGIKKGILEYVDCIVINKADRDPALANIAKQQYLSALKILKGQNINIEICSALTGLGVKQVVDSYIQYFKEFNYFKRQQFEISWFESLLISEFKKRIKKSEKFEKKVNSLKEEIQKNKIGVIEAVDLFFDELSF